jgi:hypothetical protein
MNSIDFGRCNHCGTALHAKYWSFERNIEQFSYAESSGKVETTINVILCERLHKGWADYKIVCTLYMPHVLERGNWRKMISRLSIKVRLGSSGFVGCWFPPHRSPI